jgi:hypothetical protein
VGSFKNLQNHWARIYHIYMKAFKKEIYWQCDLMAMKKSNLACVHRRNISQYDSSERCGPWVSWFLWIIQSKNWLIDYLRFYVPLKNISLIWRRHHCRWRAAKFRPMLGAQVLWAGRDLYRATPAVTRHLGFSGLIRRTAPFSRLLWHTRGCGGSILTRILMGFQSKKKYGKMRDCLWLFITNLLLYSVDITHGMILS